MTRNFLPTITKEARCYVSKCLEVASEGTSVEEALANLREALELRLEDRAVRHLT